MPYLRPDGKTQVSVRYVEGKPTQVEKIVVSTQHAEDIEHAALREELIANVIMPVVEAGRHACRRRGDTREPHRAFVIGGPMGDAD